MNKTQFDRTAEDVGNIIAMEHVNVTVPDQSMATFFYVSGLGFTRDPFVDFGPFNVWVNVGEQQFHLPTNTAQVLRGHVGVVVPDLPALAARLGRIERRLAGTRFSYRERRGWVDVTCPFGNRIRCFAPARQFGDMHLGIPYVQLDVGVGTTPGLARFYNEILGAPAHVTRGTCTVSVGRHQTLRFAETRKKLPDYDGHHIAIYVADFSGPHSRLLQRGLISEESDQHQYRFQHLVDPDSNEKLFELEHEVRSLFHPMYARNLTNRNAAQSFGNYVKGRDAFVP
ncbi:MAG: VOC family protein [Pseudomonadota bacterium]